MELPEEGRAVARAPKELLTRSSAALGRLGTAWSTVARDLMQFVADNEDLLARVVAKAEADDIDVSDLLRGMLESYAPE